MSGAPSAHPRRGSWRVALRYARRDAWRHRGRTALVAIMVALPSGLGAAVAVLAVSTTSTPATQVADQLGTDPHVQASIRFDGPGTVVQDPRGSSSGSSSDQTLAPIFTTKDGSRTADDSTEVLPVPVHDYEEALAATLPSGDELVPVVEAYSRSLAASGSPGVHRSVTADQVLSGSTTALSRFGVGYPLQPGEIAVGRDVARDLHVGVGDQVTLSENDTTEVLYYQGGGSFTSRGTSQTKDAQTFTVAEVTRRTSGVVLGPGGPLTAPATFDFWRESSQGSSDDRSLTWLVTGPHAVGWSDAQRTNQLGAEVFSRAVVLHPPADAVAAYEALYGADGSSVSGTSAAVVVGAVVLGLLQAVLMIGPAFQVGARRSARDLALLAANGADPRTVRRTVLAGGLVIGTVASVVATTAGTALAAAGIRILTPREVLVPWSWLAAFVTVGVLIALAAAWMPARRASRLDPVLVLAGRRADPLPRRWPAVVGSALAAGGILLALVGAAARLPVMVLVAGIVVAELGIVVAAGAIVGALTRLARALPSTPRLALRDAARHRARTAPAVAAVLAATAAAVAGLVVASSQAQHDRLSYLPDAGTGTVLVGPLGDQSRTLSPAQVSTLTSGLEDRHAVDGPVLQVTAVRGAAQGDTPFWTLPAQDDRPVSSIGFNNALGTVVDDGSSVRRLQLLGVPDPARAARALRAGRVVVPQGYVTADGTVTVNVSVTDTDTDSADPTTVTLPATQVGGTLDPPTNLPLVPPSVAAHLGLRTGVSGLVSAAPRPGLGTAAQTSLEDALGTVVPPAGRDGSRYAGASVYVETGHRSWGDSPLLAEALIAGGALLVALAAAWIATALAGTESLPDLATLQAVGAPPRTRRRFAAAQSAVITVTGAALGAVTGLVIGATVVLAQREGAEAVDPTWMVDVPWPWICALVAAIPLLGASAAWLVTRSRLPMTRRLDR